MYLFKMEYMKAESCYKELSSCSDKEIRSRGRTCLALVPLYQGKFEETLEVLDNGIAADRMERAEGREYAHKHLLKAIIYEEMESLNSALAEAAKRVEAAHRVEPNAVVYGRQYYVKLLAKSHDFEKAEKIAQALKKDIEEKDPTLMYNYWYASGYIEFSKGNLETARTFFERAAQASTHYYLRFRLAKTCLTLNRLSDAVAEFEKVLSRYDLIRARIPVAAVQAHYFLGLAYERSGWTDKAVDQYETFLDIWKDADESIEEVEEARERLKALKIEN
jgi:tetratricopeptide (TPR) repeat protein